jgi:hypothetical protein
MLIADADVPPPVIEALKVLRYPIATYDEVGAPIRPDKALMAHILAHSRVLVTRDLGIPSQAYVAQYAEQGLTIVLLRWKTSTYRDFQEMTKAILHDGARWEEIASNTPSVISVNRQGSRYRAWTEVPDSISRTSAAAC